jgi:hypothetical protein
MSYIRLRPGIKKELEHIAGEDYSMSDVVRILLDNFIEPDEDDDEEPLSLFYCDEDDD